MSESNTVENNNADSAPVENNKPTPTIILTPYTPLQPTNSNNGDMCMQALNKANEVLVIIFKKEYINKVEPKKWKDFEELTKNKGKKFSIAYTLVEKNDKAYYYFNGFA